MYKIAVILAAGGARQNSHFLPSYYRCSSGYPHDLIMVHRNFQHIEKPLNKDGSVYFLNKIIDGKEIPHAAFGAYRFGYQNFLNYDFYVFTSDDVIIKRDGWLKDIIDKLYSHKKIGFGASQVFNGGKKYPHPSHLRSPFLFVKKECLALTNWNFDSDHDGEMKFGDQLADTGFFGIQVGNKINLAYDADETNHITQLLEKKVYPNASCFDKIENINIDIPDEYIISPYSHIGKQNILSDIEPYDGLIYRPTIHIAKKYLTIKEVINDTFCI